MIANRGAIIHEPTQSATIHEPTQSATREGPVSTEPATRAIATRMVIEAYSAAARRGAGATEGPFDTATRAYIRLNPGASRDAAARAVADIISHQS